MDIILLPGFEGFFCCCSFSQAVTSLTQAYFFFFPNNIVEIYLPLSCTFSGIFILSSTGFGAPCLPPFLWFSFSIVVALPLR